MIPVCNCEVIPTIKLVNTPFISHHDHFIVVIMVRTFKIYSLSNFQVEWRRAWQPTPVFLPGESHRERNRVGYSPQGRKELDMAEVTEHRQQTAHTIQYSQLSSPCCMSDLKTCSPCNWKLVPFDTPQPLATTNLLSISVSSKLQVRSRISKIIQHLSSLSDLFHLA